nr:uncharacterized protein CTRU02_14669 [Colletotrichum truncatum]XP_036585130.1 uncharacterized protein CTRU02_05099 [Colletotrichum truncatum]KAF6781988.1 hypothetical protein CTRU02_14669 [Colletotrichum truncatum]KAF6794898.1 hypothetical protein CTRU02_05099 [Colletotrichum truncatum]
MIRTEYPLHNSAIYDSGSSLHVFNNRARFSGFRAAEPGDYLWAGASQVPILGYGNVDITADAERGKKVRLRLYNVAYCEEFATNLVSYRLLRQRGMWWDNRPGQNCVRRADGTLVCYLHDLHGQQVIEDNTKAGFVTQAKQRHTSFTPRKRLAGRPFR